MAAYYNEIDPYAAQWLRNLIAAGRIAPGDVDERSIEDVRPDDLVGYRQCHFFAGIGIWSLALRCAGVADDELVWTGSCPCQPFSSAGARGGFDDERHLWPAWYWLISQCRPGRIYGEQVASPDGLTWLELVSADLAGAGYSGWVDDLCSAGFGAPNLRQRLYFVAEPEGDERRREQQAQGTGRRRAGPSGSGVDGSMGVTDRSGRPQGDCAGATNRHGHTSVAAGSARSMGDAERTRLEGHAGHGDDGDESGRVGAYEAGPTAAASRNGSLGDPASGGFGEQWGEIIARRYGYPDLASRDSAVRGFWHSADWILCRDPAGPKWRAVDRGAFPLAPGNPVRVAGLRAGGNALNAEVATEFIRAHLGVTEPKGIMSTYPVEP